MNKGTLIFTRPAVALATLALALVAALVIALTGSTPQNAAAAATVTINIKDYAYSKKSVTVSKGTTIKWVNKDSMKHDVHGGSGGPRSKLLAKNKSYSWKASKAGTFSYYCTPHPYMKGKIIVK